MPPLLRAPLVASLLRASFVATLALPVLPAAAQDLTFGPTAEVPGPRAGYNGWMSNQMGVTEALMEIGYDLSLYPRLAEGIEQVGPTIWRVTLREGLTFHDWSPMTKRAAALVDGIAARSDNGHPGFNDRLSTLLDL